MSNNLIVILEIVVVFCLLLVAKKLFGKAGVQAWVCIASILANIVTAKNADIFGFSTAIGTVMFASTFLATDIMTECYGAKYARQSVFMGLCSTAVFVIASQIALLYTPSAIDYADGAMQTLFSMNLRISISSMVMYFIANMADVYLYDTIRKRMGGKAMWLRNNISTILCNCLENFLFIGFAFWGVYTLEDIFVIALSTSVIEIIVGLCDTPFLYLARRIRHGDEKGKIA